VIFGLCAATIPILSIAPKQISDNEWFKFAKDTGVVYVLLVVPVMLLAAYAALLRAAGGIVVAATMVVFPPSPRANRYRLLTPETLEPLALLVGKDDFNLDDLQTKSSELVLKYQSQKDGQWKSLEESISNLTKNSLTYLGDFVLFLFFWIALFKLLPPTSWVHDNERCYWSVVLVLMALAWFAWFRVSRALSVVPSLLLMSIPMLMRVDPDLKTVLEVSEEQRQRVRQKLQELLQKEREIADSRPSLLQFIKYKTGKLKKSYGGKQARQNLGRPFPRLYRKGYAFSIDENCHGQYGDGWLEDYAAYLYYRVHQRVSNLASTVWQLARYIVTGAP